MSNYQTEWQFTKVMDHVQTELLTKGNGPQRDGPPRIEFWTTLIRSDEELTLETRSLGLTEVLGFSRALRSMAARPSDDSGGEVEQREDHGDGDPQQILRSCAQSLLTPVPRLEDRLLTNSTQTPVARSSTSPNTCTLHFSTSKVFNV